MKNKSYFIARDKNNSLWMYDCKPQRHDENWLFPNGCASYVELDAFNAAHGVDMFKYMTYDDDPIELVLIDKAKPSIKESSKDCFDSIFDMKL